MDLQKGLRAADATFEKFFDSHVYRDGISAVLTDEAIKAVDPAKAAFMCNCNSSEPCELPVEKLPVRNQSPIFH